MLFPNKKWWSAKALDIQHMVLVNGVNTATGWKGSVPCFLATVTVLISSSRSL